MSHIGFGMVQKSVTLNNLERRNGHYLAFSPNSVAIGADYVKVVEEGEPRCIYIYSLQ